MLARALFAFWLGRLDTQVATGELPSGVGTRDIRFCSVGDKLRAFLANRAANGQHWRLTLEHYPQAGIPQWVLPITEYRFRGRECALPGQSPTSQRPYLAYPLWRMRVRLLSSSERPKDCILLIRDDQNRFHARVVRWEELESMPEIIRGFLTSRNECGDVLELPQGIRLVDMPIKGVNVEEVPFVAVPTDETLQEKLERLARLGSRSGSRVSVAERRARSRQLAEELKTLYDFRCQLCGGDMPRIDMGGGRYYVEVHHLQGLAEAGSYPNDDQEASSLDLDSFLNVIVLCPFHHRLLHFYRSPITFDRKSCGFRSKDGSLTIQVATDKHLCR